MPTYHYVCSKCDHEFELFQPMTAEPLEICPKEHCGRQRWGKGKVKRVLSGGAGLIFKGSGFYITDYRSEGYHKAAKSDAEAAKPKSEKSGDSSSKSTGSGGATSKSTGGKPAT
ncbi:MAG: zinc ribbon domain-containing protein [Verrucomicrobiales bacterium]|nr:zinc ribbon domain-containing protein [Verrucomicrobiales bacterium]